MKSTRAATLALACALAVPVHASPAPAAPEREAFLPAQTVSGNYLAALVASAGRDTRAAATYIREALRGDPKNFDLVERSFEAQLADGNMEEASRLARRLLERDQSNGLAKLALAVRDIKAGKFADARGRLQAGLRGRAADITAALLSAWTFAGTGQPARAIEIVERLKGEGEIAIYRDYHAGLISDLAGNGEEAGRRLKRAYEAAGRGRIAITEAYGRHLAKRGAAQEATEVFQTFEQRVSRHPLIRTLIDDVAAGRRVEVSVGSAQEGAAEVMFGLGTEGSRQGDEIAAIVYLQLARHLDPKHEFAVIALADIYERQKLYDKAIALYETIDPASPLHAAAQVQIGLNLETVGKPDESIERLRGLVATRPADVEAVSALGNVLRAQKRFPEAAEVFTRGIEALPAAPDRSHWSLFYFRGSALERSKQWERAEADFRRALELNPDQPQVMNYLGYSLVERGEKLEEAFGLLRRAVEQAPRDGYIVDSLGWGYFKLGRYEDAVRELERAVLLRPADPTINDHLGDAYWKNGRRLEASFQWSHARDLKPEPDELARIEAKIERGLEEAPAPVQAEAQPDGR